MSSDCSALSTRNGIVNDDAVCASSLEYMLNDMAAIQTSKDEVVILRLSALLTRAIVAYSPPPTRPGESSEVCRLIYGTFRIEMAKQL